MSNETQPQVTVQEQPQAPVKVSAAIGISNDVKEKLKADNIPIVRARVVQKLVDKEIEDREKLILKGLEAIKTAEIDLKKIKPDQITYNEAGVESKVFTKPKMEEKKKAEKKLADLDAAVTAAIQDGQYDKLKNMLGGGGGGKPEGKVEGQPEATE